MSRAWVHRRGKLYEVWKSLNPKWFIDLGPGRDPPHSIRIGEAYVAIGTWPDIKVIGVEAYLPHYQMQKEFEFPGTLLNLAVWDKDDEELLIYADSDEVDGKYEWMSTIPPVEDSPWANTVTEAVRTVTLDTLETEYGPFEDAIIWADIQGSELKMLQGADKLLKSGRVIALNLEVSPKPYEGWPAEAVITKHLDQLGFRPATTLSTKHAFYDMLYVRK